jgi:hypothetical protein
LHQHHLLRVHPFGIARQFGELLVIKRSYINTGKVMSYED